MNLLRILVVVAVLVAVISAFMPPANAQGARGYEPYSEQRDSTPLTDLPGRWMRSGGTPIIHSEEQKGKSRLRSLFHNGGATSVPEGSNCEACH